MTSRWRRLSTLLLGPVLVATVTACGGDDAGEGEQSAADPRPATTQPASATPGAATAGSAPRRETGEIVPGRPEVSAAPADLSDFACGREGRAWSASGDITNSTDAPMTYTLTVVTVEGTDDVTGEQVEEFALQPEESTEFDLAEFSRAQADACLPRLLRAPR